MRMCREFVLPGSDHKLCSVSGAHMVFDIIPIEVWLLMEETEGRKLAKFLRHEAGDPKSGCSRAFLTHEVTRALSGFCPRLFGEGACRSCCLV